MIVTDRMVDEDFFFNETFVEKRMKKRKYISLQLGLINNTDNLSEQEIQKSAYVQDVLTVVDTDSEGEI